MKEKFLMKCDTSIFANEIVEQLEANGIASRVVDETKGAAFGYGPNVGMSIYVDENDYEKAKSIADPIVENREHTQIWCPKCGSEDISPIEKGKHSASGKMIASLILILIGGLYFCLANLFKESFGVVYRSFALDIVVIVLIFIGFLLLFFGGHASCNYHCNHCGKDFFHQ